MYASKLLPGCGTRPAHKLSKFSTNGTPLHATTGRFALFSRATQLELLRICGYDEGSGRSAFNQSRRSEGWARAGSAVIDHAGPHTEGKTAPTLSLTGNREIMVESRRGACVTASLVSSLDLSSRSSGSKQRAERREARKQMPRGWASRAKAARRTELSVQPLHPTASTD